VSGPLHFSSEVLGKAVKLVGEGRVAQDLEHPAVWWVWSKNSPDRPYRVQLGHNADGSIAFATCTCFHGLNVGAGDCRCYHVAGVLMCVSRQTDGDSYKVIRDYVDATYRAALTGVDGPEPNVG
jgi:predicted nucleic acid-binding Zn finger protein